MKKYFAFISDQVKGPFSPDQLKQLTGFSRGTMVYPEDLVDGTEDDWKPAFQISEFGAIPFTTLKPPPITPATRTGGRQPESSAFTSAQKTIPSTSDPSDLEKIKLMEHIHNLEKELNSAKNQAIEIENLKIQLREKEQKLYELSQELKKSREQSVPALKSSPAASEADYGQSDSLDGNDDYTQLNIPIKKIAAIGVGALALGVVIWAFLPHSMPNQFFRELFSQGALSVPEEALPVDSPPVQAEKPKPKPKPKARPPVAAKIKKIARSSAKKRLEEQILNRNALRRKTMNKVLEYENRGISSSDPDWQKYIDAQYGSVSAEKAFTELADKYVKTYGKTAWKDFEARSKKSTAFEP